MAGVTGRKYADGSWRIWYMDGAGKQKFARGTRSKRESRQLAKELETRERGVGSIPQAPPMTQEVRRGHPIDDIVSDYLAWGETQGGLIGGSWSTAHASEKRAKLGYWKERLGLEYVGDLRGKLPAAEACLRELKAGRTNKTLNGYIDALKSLSAWCVDRDYLEENPFRKLRLLDGRPQVERRALTVEEAALLLAAAPPDRRILYETALLSGLRANECRQLTLRHLDHKNGGIWLVAEWTKGRRDCLQPLPGWFLDHLHEYGRQNIASTVYEKHRSERSNVPAEPLFFVPHHTARSLNIDLSAAGIEKSTPEGKIDFHALRTTFSTLLDDVGATEKTKEVLLRHAPATLAHKRYVKVRSGRPNEAVEQVAELLGLSDFLCQNYAKTMPKPLKMAVGQDYNPLNCQGVRCGTEVVGAPGFEPGAFGSQSRRATRLRYAPIGLRNGGGLTNREATTQSTPAQCIFPTWRRVPVLLRQVAFQRIPKCLHQWPRQGRPPPAQTDRYAQSRVGKAHQGLHRHPERPRHPQRHQPVSESDPRHLRYRLEGFHGVFNVDVHTPLPLTAVDLALDEAPGLRLRRGGQHPQFPRNGKLEPAQVTRHDNDGFVNDVAGFQVRGVFAAAETDADHVFAGTYPLDDLRPTVGIDAQPDTGVLPPHLGQHLGAPGDENGGADRNRQLTGVVRHLFTQRLPQLPQQRPRTLQHVPGVRCQLDPPAAAFDQGFAQLTLQIGNALAHRRLRDRQPQRGPGHSAALG